MPKRIETVPKITKTLIQSLKTDPTKRTFVWDSDVPGFGIAIQKSGNKSFVFQYRLHSKTNRVAIGSIGHLSPDQARKQARELAYEVSKGNDPARNKRELRNAISVSLLLDLYIQSAAFRSNAETTKSTDKGRIERHLKPTLGKRLANNLTAEEVRIAMEKIKSGETSTKEKTRSRGLARVTGGEGTARKSIVLLKTAFGWAESESLINSNQIRFFKVTGGKRRTWTLSHEDYKKAFQAIDHLVSEGALHPATADCIRIIALTGARRGEITGLLWKQVDLKKGVAVLDEHKTGRKTGEARHIGLPTEAQKIISRQPTRKALDFVFQTTPGKQISLGKPLRQIRDKAGLPPEFCLHSFRHSLATNAADSGASAHEIQSLLGHKTLAMAAHYVHQSKDKKAQLAQKFSSGISAALTGIDSAEVLDIEAK